MQILRYAALYHTYRSPIVRLVRGIFFLGILIFITFSISQGILPKFALFFLSTFLTGEIFYRYKVSRVQPQQVVNGNASHDVYESCTLPVLDAIFFSSNIKQIITVLLAKKSIQFILHKANIAPGEVLFLEIDKKILAEKAYALVKELNGKYITEMDIFVAYLLLTEYQTKLLFQKHIREDELLHILYWSKFDFSEEETPPEHRIVFLGEGLGESFTTGWTLETQKYITDITYKVLDEKPVVLGRRAEYQSLVDALSKPTRNNVMLVGETGSGKTSLVEALALNSFLGYLSGKLYHKRVYQLRVGLLVAGTKDVGDLEGRLESILEEIAHAGNIILFISEVEQILGSETYKIDLSGSLLPYLRSPYLPIITTTTPGAYKNFIAPVSEFIDLFEVIRMDEPNREQAIQMLLERANDIEKKNSVFLTYKAIVSAVDLAKRYMPGRALPGSAVKLLESVAAQPGKLSIDEADVIAKIEQQTHGTIAAPGAKEKELLLHLEAKIHERIIDQDEAVSAIAQAIRRLRAGITSQNRPISFLFLGPTGVGKTETAKALASVYFGGEDRIIRLDMSEYTNPDSVTRLLGSSPGQGKERGELTEKVAENPFSLILLDEFEKAHTEVLDLFLQVFDDGRLTDSKGKTVSFANTIIIATSNAGALYIQDQLEQGREITAQFQRGLLQELEKTHIFKPELLNRFDGIIVFKPLSEEDIENIANFFLQALQKKLQEQEISISFDQNLAKRIAHEGFDTEFGARPLRRFLQDKIEDAIAKEMLIGTVARGASIHISADSSGAIIITPTA